LEELLSILESITILQKVVFPVHPRTLKQLETFQLSQRFTQIPNLLIIDPLGYLEFLKLMENASVVITDSGGIQEETTYLRVPCLTLRDTTERPITITLGTNELMPLKASLLEKRIQKIFLGQRKTGHIPYLWDGNAAKRIVDILVNFS